jgi:hypothetical protein
MNDKLAHDPSLRPVIEHPSDRLAVVADRATGKTTAALARYEVLRKRHAISGRGLMPLYVTKNHAEVMHLGRQADKWPGPNFTPGHFLMEQIAHMTLRRVVLVVDHLPAQDRTWLLDRLPLIESRVNVVSVTVFSDPGLIVLDNPFRPWSILRMSINQHPGDADDVEQCKIVY